MRPLTSKQAALLAFCGQFYATNDQLPPHQQIADHFGWASMNAAVEMMYALRVKGYIERNATGKWKFTSKGRAFITADATAARWFPTNGTAEPMNGVVCASSTC